MPFDWLVTLSPWLQGLFGGIGVTLLWELGLKPRRARRAVARVLAEEVSLALEGCAAARLQAVNDPQAIPSDFHIGTAAFDAISSQLGELAAKDIGNVVLFYHHAGKINGLSEPFGRTLEKWQDLAVVGDTKQRQDLRAGLERFLTVYHDGLEKMVERANQLLPRLRRLAVPWWRLDYLIRKKSVLSLDELRHRVNEHNAKLKRGAG